MKKIVNVVEVENEGFLALLGQNITCFCNNYIWTGTLLGVNDEFIQLGDPAIVYETGAFTEKKWRDVQKFGVEVFYLPKARIEAFGVLNKTF